MTIYVQEDFSSALESNIDAKLFCYMTFYVEDCDDVESTIACITNSRLGAKLKTASHSSCALIRRKKAFSAFPSENYLFTTHALIFTSSLHKVYVAV